MAKVKYAIIREEKRTDTGQLTRCNTHNARTKPVKNARPDGPAPTLLFGPQNLTKAVKEVIPKDRRKNAVIAVEVVLTASPEWFANATPEVYQEWVKANIAYLKERHGSNLIQVWLHEDEASPHLHAFWVPLRDGKLNYRAIQGTPLALAQLQDQYAAAMRNFGLHRGQHKSERRHQHHSAVVIQLDEARNRIKAATKAMVALADHIGTVAATEAYKKAAEALAGAPLTVRDARRSEAARPMETASERSTVNLAAKPASAPARAARPGI